MASYVPTYFCGALMQKLVSVGADTWKVSLNTGNVPTSYDLATEYYGGIDFPNEVVGSGYLSAGATVTVTQAIYTVSSVHQWCATANAGTGAMVNWTSATLANVTYAILYDVT